MKEDVEQIDEISKKLQASYLHGASTNLADVSHAEGMSGVRGDHKEVAKYRHKELRRRKGIAMVADKLAKEEVEPINEISSKTKLAYIKKAVFDLGVTSQGHGAVMASPGSYRNPYVTGKTELKRMQKREKGINRAAKSLAPKSK